MGEPNIIKNYINRGFIKEPIDSRYPDEPVQYSYIIECDEIYDKTGGEIKKAFELLFPDKKFGGMSGINVPKGRMFLYYLPIPSDKHDECIKELNKQIKRAEDEIDILTQKIKFYEVCYSLNENEQEEFDQIGKKSDTSNKKQKKLL